MVIGVIAGWGMFGLIAVLALARVLRRTADLDRPAEDDQGISRATLRRLADG